MKRFKRVLSIIMAVVLVFSLMTACAKKEKEVSKGDPVATTEPKKEPTKEPITLTTVSMYGGADAKAPTYQEINKKFMDDNPHVTIEDDSQMSDQDWKTRVAADFAVGNEPDVILYFTDANASDVLAADKFVTLDEIKAVYPEYAADTLESALAAVTNPDGVRRAVPTVGYWEGLFVNKDLFEQYSLELPTDWDKLVTAIDTFKANDIIPIAVSLNTVPHYWIEHLMLSAAGLEGYETVPQAAPADWIAGLNMFKTLRDMGAFPVDTDTIDNELAGELFKSKKAAMQLDGAWFAGNIPDQDNTIVMAFPNIPGAKAAEKAMVGGMSSGFYITKKAWDDPAKRDAAVKFVMAHTSKESITKYWNGNGQPSVAVDPLDNMTPLALSGIELSNNATSISAPTDARISQEAYNTFAAGIVEISTGAKTPETLINEILAINSK